MIYRVVGESSEWVWSEESGAMEISLSPGRLMGAFNAGVAYGTWGGLPMPMLSNPGYVSGSPPDAAGAAEYGHCSWSPGRRDRQAALRICTHPSVGSPHWTPRLRRGSSGPEYGSDLAGALPTTAVDRWD